MREDPSTVSYRKVSGAPEWLTPEAEAVARRLFWEHNATRKFSPEAAEEGLKPAAWHWVVGGVLVVTSLAAIPYFVINIFSWIALALGVYLLYRYWKDRAVARKIRPFMRLATRGRVRLAWPVMMNSDLMNGRIPQGTALVLVCGDDGAELLGATFKETLDALMDADPGSTDPDQRALAAIESDEVFEMWRRRRIPLSLTDGRIMYACDLVVFAKDLAAKPKDFPWIPCLVEPGETGAIWVLSTSIMSAVMDVGRGRTPAGSAFPPPLPGRRPIDKNLVSKAPPTTPGPPALPAGTREKPRIPSITMLRQSPAGLTLSRVSDVVLKELGTGAKVTEIGRNATIGGFMIEQGDAIYAVHDSTKPYVARPGLSAWASGLNSVQATRLAEMHSAFVAVDCMKSPADAKVMYSVLGRLAAELLDDHCLLLYSTELGTAAVPDEGTVEALRTDPMGVFPGHSVSYVGPRNETMTSQIAEARRRWPEFETAFRDHAREGLFMVKAGFQHERGTEHMWFVVDTIADGRVSGKLANKPVYVRDAAEGDRVSEVVGEISDWTYAYAGNAAGGFTDPQIRAMLQR